MSAATWNVFLFVLVVVGPRVVASSWTNASLRTETLLVTDASCKKNGFPSKCCCYDTEIEAGSKQGFVPRFVKHPAGTHCASTMPEDDAAIKGKSLALLFKVCANQSDDCAQVCCNEMQHAPWCGNKCARKECHENTAFRKYTASCCGEDADIHVADTCFNSAVCTSKLKPMVYVLLAVVVLLIVAAIVFFVVKKNGGGGGGSARETQLGTWPTMEGAYLVESETNQGCLILHWSKTEVSGALAQLKPQKPVPNHKFSTNDGKTELVRQANLGVHKQNYFLGVCQFIKAGKEYDSTLVMLSDKVSVNLHFAGDTVSPVKKNVSIQISDADCVACGPGDEMDFKGVGNLPLVQFQAISQKNVKM